MKYLILIFTFHFWLCSSQNLVPNNSFESISNCPLTQSQINLAYSWIGYGGTPDLFNSCFLNDNGVGVPKNLTGYQTPRTGNGYAGIYTYGYNIREYIQVNLFQV